MANFHQRLQNNDLGMIYIAAPLFSEAEILFNRHLKKILERSFRVYLPQEDGELLNDTVKSGGDTNAAIKRIFIADINAIQACDILFIVLDGRTVDEGACFELGVAYTLGKICLGLQTGPRRLLEIGNNPMITASLDYIFLSTHEVESWIKNKNLVHKTATDDRFQSIKFNH